MWKGGVECGRGELSAGGLSVEGRGSVQKGGAQCRREELSVEGGS